MTNIHNLGNKGDKAINDAVKHVDDYMSKKSSLGEKKRLEIAKRVDHKLKTKRAKKLNRRKPTSK